MGLLKLSSTRIFWVIFFMFVFLLTSQAIAQNKVVVIPLFGDEQTISSIPAPVEKTGQYKCYDTEGNEIVCVGTGQDGELQKGVEWPNPRFTDNENGTVTDNLTGLIWLKNANCLGSRAWGDALSACNGLANGSCGLTDGSSAGDWRLPNVRELHSLIDYGRYNHAIPPLHPFINEQNIYWSSTTCENRTSYAWLVSFYYGDINGYNKESVFPVWAVRGGQ